MNALIPLTFSAALASHATPPLPPPPEAPEIYVDNPTCVSCGSILEEPTLGQELSRANAGDPNAAFRVYLHYISAENQHERAIWLQRAAELGHPTAQYNLWFDLRESPLCTDRALALSWLEKSAAQGVALAKGKLDAFRKEVQSCSSSRLRPNNSFKPKLLRNSA